MVSGHRASGAIFATAMGAVQPAGLHSPIKGNRQAFIILWYYIWPDGESLHFFIIRPRDLKFGIRTENPRFCGKNELKTFDFNLLDMVKRL